MTGANSEAGTAANAAAPPYSILGMRIDALDPGAIVERVMAKAEAGRGAYCCVGNVHQCMLVRDEDEFAGVVNGADLVVTDSRILHRFIAAKYGLRLGPTIRGAELMLELCARAAEANVPVALIGGRDEALLEDLIRQLTGRFPRLSVAYRYSPPFRPLRPDEETRMIEGLRRSGARLVFVGLGCPKQERWMATYAPRVEATMIGVGAAFDQNGGRVSKSPEWVHAAGLEWAYRLLSEPRRLWRRYLVDSPRFLFAYWREERGHKARETA